MFNSIYAACVNITHFSSVVQTLEQLISYTASDYGKDGNVPDAMIDAMIQVLQAHKTVGK
jgi:hypothetical protein